MEAAGPSSSLNVSMNSQESAEQYDVAAESVEEEQSTLSVFEGGFFDNQAMEIPASITKDPLVDVELRQDLQRQQSKKQAQSLLEFRQRLPAFERQQDFLKLIDQNRVVVVSGLTGCGKSTQLPQALLDDLIQKGDGSTTFIVCTQPRRISAISLAERVALERGGSLKEPEKDR